MAVTELLVLEPQDQQLLLGSHSVYSLPNQVPLFHRAAN